MCALRHSEYQIGIVCALPKEAAAVAAVLDDEHPVLGRVDTEDSDNNTYILGRIHQHNVVITCLPAGIIGTNAAAASVTNLARTFKNVRLGLMVGIGGGIPNLPEQDIRLGDVVVSQPNGEWPGVVQYDMGKHLGMGNFERTGSLDKPSTSLLTALAILQTQHFRNTSKVPMYMREALQRCPILEQNGYSFPGTDKDHLHCAYCNSTQWWWRWWLILRWLLTLWYCDVCVDRRVRRRSRQNEHPALHYGTIASANSLVKDAAFRDQLRRSFNAKCVEMEASGLMNNFPCLVIRGICDYADAYKSNVWQEYAALAAAAFTKELLCYVVPKEVKEERPLGIVIGIIEKQLDLAEELLLETKQQNKRVNIQYDSEQHKQCHRFFNTSTYEEFKNNNPDRTAGTCKWVLYDPVFCRWYDSTTNALLWISADPGCGKSVLSRSLIDNELRRTGDVICYFFFEDTDIQDHLATALCAILHQLFVQEPDFIRYAIPFWENNRNVAGTDELWRILMTAVVSSPDLKLICVFDALDKCRDTDRPKLIRLLTRFYEDSFKEHSVTMPSDPRRGRLKFLVTSRPYSDIQEGFYLPDYLPSIRILGENASEQIRSEINIVIRSWVKDLAVRLSLDNTVKCQLEARLLGMEHRTYLWLYLAFKSIKEAFRTSLRPDREPIDYLPSSVSDAYEKILGKISKQEDKRSHATRILQIVVGARRPLTISEMAVALGIAISPQITTLDDMRINENELQERIRQLCGLFISFSNSKVFLIHQTAKDFLLREQPHAVPEDVWKHCLDPFEVETEMARICIEFLLLKDVDDPGRSLAAQILDQDIWSPERVIKLNNMDGLQCFIAYSTEYWAAHLRSSGLFPEDWLSEKVLRLYDTNNIPFKWWFPIFKESSMPILSLPEMTAYRLAAMNGHDDVMKLLLRDVDSASFYTDDDIGIAMILAGKFGHESTISLLLEKGVYIDARDKYGRTALHEASGSGRHKIAEFLLNKGADINTQDQFGWTALYRASASGRYKVVELLLNRNARINARTSNGETALYRAAFYGYYKVVELLLGRGADANVRGEDGRTALSVALSFNSSKTAELLLRSGAVEE